MHDKPRDSDTGKRRPPRPAAPAPQTAPPPDTPDDDAVVVPAPDPSVFGAAVALHARTHASARAQRLGLRRTLIPILLTCGVLMPTLAILWLRLEPDDPIRAGTGAKVPIALVAIGIVLLALAILNILQVRHLLHAAAKRSR